MDKIYIGIDPGKSGGICIISDEEHRNMKCFKCPATTHDMAEYLILAKNIGDCVAVVEKVWSFPGQGVRSVWTFAENYGTWLGILSALHIQYKLVTPVTWMKFYSVPKMEKKDRKNYLKQLAQQMYPDHKITLWNADAILLANYLKKTH